MKVTVHFIDGERLDGTAEQVTFERGGFTLVGTVGNTRSAWVGAGAIKYIVVRSATDETYGDEDPRAATGLAKVVLHFLDGEIQRSYRDSLYSEQAGGFVVRLWDPDSHQLLRALVPGSSLKGVFEVAEWDSRTADEKLSRSGTRRRPPEDTEPEDAEAEDAQPEDAQPEDAEQAEPGPPEPEEAEPWVAELEEAAAQRPADAAEPEMGDSAEPKPEPPARVTQPVTVDEALREEALLDEAMVAAPAYPAPTPGMVPLPGAPAPVSMTVASSWDPLERRPGFGSGLTKRRRVTEPLTPEQERHLALRLRISEVLGALGPDRDEESEEPGSP